MKRAFTIAAAVLALSGCEGKHATFPVLPVPVPEMQITGAFVGSAENGLLEVTVETRAFAAPRFQAGPAEILRAPAAVETTVTALGTMSKDGGGVVNLTGTFDTVTDSLRLSGQGYSLWGLYLPNGVPRRLEGRYAGPAGNGRFVLLIGARSAVHVFCATYENRPTATFFGTIDLAVMGTSLAGFQVEDGDTLVEPLWGSVNGSGLTRAVSFTGTSFYGNGSWDLTTGDAAGVWASPRGSGVWSGGVCVAGTTGPNILRRASAGSSGPRPTRAR
ncbi:MAG: hypothetical protein ACM3PF_06875 [Bacteroidota bacterium]